MRDKLIPEGEIDGRSIRDVRAADIIGFDQCHFFAGLGGWAYAGSLAGWSERQWWSGSCPCQPLSGAGQRQGHADERHLWPAFHDLIAECCPSVVVGEQTESDIGREWFAGVRADLEASGFACGGADLCAASVKAPHPRQRLYWVAKRLADAAGIVIQDKSSAREFSQPQQNDGDRESGMVDATSERRREGRPQQPGRQREPSFAEPNAQGRVVDASNATEGRRIIFGSDQSSAEDRQWSSDELARSDDRARPDYENTVDLECWWDGKIRRAPSGLPMLVDGLPDRILAFHMFGNAIHAELAQTWLQVCADL